MNRYNLPKTGRAIGWIMATVIIVIATYSAAAWITADAWPLTVFRAPYAWRWRTSFGTTWLAFFLLCFLPFWLYWSHTARRWIQHLRTPIRNVRDPD
jgi:hypothetical protein